MARTSVADGGFARRDVLGLLIAGAATFQARSALAAAACTPTPLPSGCDCKPYPDTLSSDDVLKKRGLLISLVADLIRDPAIRDDFNNNPDKLIARYGLPVDALAAFYTMSRECMHTYMTAQTAAWLDQFACYVPDNDLKSYKYDEPGLGSYDPNDPTKNCDQLADPAYPSPKPQIKQVRPGRYSVANGDLRLNIYGQSFPRTATVEFVGPSGTPTTPKSQTVSGTFRTSRLVAVFDANDLMVNPGDYKLKVVVKSSDAPNCLVELANWACPITITP
jgi:hypothetical protein